MGESSPNFTLTNIEQALATDDSPRLGNVLVQHRDLASSYRPWRKFKYVAAELGLDPDEAWKVVKLSQLGQCRYIDSLRQADGRPFALVNAPQLLASLHRIDRGVGGGGPAVIDEEKGLLGDSSVLNRLRIKSLMDEAAESSLIEGASGTRKQATDLLRSGREPSARGERMIVNNFVAMQQIKSWLERRLSPEMLIELQAILTEGTLDDPSEAGRLRRPDEDVRVVDTRDGATTYEPPAAQLLPARLRALCAFANHDHGGADFLHPIVKASILHFMIGYEHPFCDGNGRTARALFYWFALRNGYTIFEFMPISERIRAGFAKYPRAYLDTEQEGGDLTHFVLYKLDIIAQSLDRLVLHLKQEEARVKRAESLLRASKSFNLRQRVLLEHALRHPSQLYTVKSHMNSNGITENTARSDLEKLVKAKCLEKLRSHVGKEAAYLAVQGLERRLGTTK